MIAFVLDLLHLGFYVLTLVTLWLFYRLTGRRIWVLVGGIAWLALSGWLAARGFFRETDALPPRLAYLMVPMLLGGLYLGFARGAADFRSRMHLEGLHYLHALRIAVELIFLKGFADRGEVATVLTYEGNNYDVAMGILLPLTGWLVFRLRVLGRGWSAAANVLGIVVLTGTVALAVLSSPSPLQQLEFEQPTVAILKLPLVWLPALVAPLMFWAHFLVLGRYWDDSRGAGRNQSI